MEGILQSQLSMGQYLLLNLHLCVAKVVLVMIRTCRSQTAGVKWQCANISGPFLGELNIQELSYMSQFMTRGVYPLAGWEYTLFFRHHYTTDSSVFDLQSYRDRHGWSLWLIFGNTIHACCPQQCYHSNQLQTKQNKKCVTFCILTCFYNFYDSSL